MTDFKIKYEALARVSEDFMNIQNQCNHITYFNSIIKLTEMKYLTDFVYKSLKQTRNILQFFILKSKKS